MLIPDEAFYSTLYHITDVKELRKLPKSVENYLDDLEDRCIWAQNMPSSNTYLPSTSNNSGLIENIEQLRNKTFEESLLKILLSSLLSLVEDYLS